MRSAARASPTRDRRWRTRTWANALATRGAASGSRGALRAVRSRWRPANAATRYDHGSLLLETGDLDRATDGAARSDALQARTTPKAHNNLGIALASQGRSPRRSPAGRPRCASSRTSPMRRQNFEQGGASDVRKCGVEVRSLEVQSARVRRATCDRAQRCDVRRPTSRNTRGNPHPAPAPRTNFARPPHSALRTLNRHRHPELGTRNSVSPYHRATFNPIIRPCMMLFGRR